MKLWILALSLNTTPAKDLSTLKGFEKVPKCEKRFVDEKQSFRVSAPGTPHDGADFVSIECTDDGPTKNHIAEFRKGTLHQVLPSHPANQWSAMETLAVTFRDVNGDGSFDIVAIISAITGIGPTGAEPFNVAGVYLGAKDGAWTLDGAASEAANKLKDPALKTVLPALKKHYGKTKKK